MAVNQYRFGLLPSLPLIKKYGTLPAHVVAEDFDMAWQQQPRYDFTTLIDSFTSSYPSWSPDIRMWGAENGNRIHVVFENGNVVEVSCRLVPGSHMEFASRVVALANDCEWILVLTNDAVAMPTLEALLTSVTVSNAARFVERPLDFLSGLSTGKYNPE